MLIAISCCVSFCCTANWVSYTYTDIPFSGFPSNLCHHRALGRVPCCCTAGSHYLSILDIVSMTYIYQSQSLNSSHLPFPTLVSTVCSLCLYPYFNLYPLPQLGVCCLFSMSVSLFQHGRLESLHWCPSLSSGGKIQFRYKFGWEKNELL